MEWENNPRNNKINYDEKNKKLPISTTPLTKVFPLQHRSKYAPFSTKGPLIDKDAIQWADLKRWSQVWQLNVLVFPYTCDYLSERQIL